MLEMDSRYALRHVLDVLAHYAGYPPVNIQKAIENGHLSLNFPLKMMIFHSYVSLPEGTSNRNRHVGYSITKIQRLRLQVGPRVRPFRPFRPFW